MKVVNEATLTSFLFDCEANSRFYYRIKPTFELIEIIAKSPKMIQKFMDKGTKFLLDAESKEFTKYLDIKDIEGICQLFELHKFGPKHLTELKSGKHLEIIEKISEKSVAEYFFEEEKRLERFEGRLMNKSEYFQWRLVFKYWIKSEQKERIREIKSADIIELLKLEFPEEYQNLNK